MSFAAHASAIPAERNQQAQESDEERAGDEVDFWFWMFDLVFVVFDRCLFFFLILQNFEGFFFCERRT